jgi:BlaI family transcriptional regulator, penicillinase repressor
MPETYDLTDLQLDLLRTLWEKREATVTEVTEALRDTRALAPTTVATLLSRLERKGVVSHRTEGRTYIYSAEISERDVRKTMLSRMTSLFEGDVAAMMSQLLDEREISADEIARVRKLLQEREAQLEEGQ